MIELLLYSSWRAQIELHGMSFQRARKLFKHAEIYEKHYMEKKHDSCNNLGRDQDTVIEKYGM